MVSGGSQLEMNGGTISDNIGAVGGILVGSYDIYAYHRQATDVSSLKTLPISTFAFNDGVIIKNKGAGYSGGLFVFGAGHAVMNGGTISENQGYSGGGVLAMDWYVDGVQGKNQTRVPVPFAEWTSRYPAGFVMKGGEITKNLAYSVGGGLSISTGQAELHGGLIANNSAGDQGGGVYVTAVPYALKVYDAYISDNLAKEDTWIQSTGVLEEGVLYELSLGSGGGIWFCPTGDAKIYIENGAAIFGNTATNAGDDFHNEDKVPGHYTVTLPTRTANGIRILWYEDDKGNRYDANDPHLVEKLRHIAEPLSLKAILADGLTEMRDLYKLFVTGNMANKGGGFGSNGTIIFGYPPTEENPLREITVTKVWTDVPSSAIPEEVVIWMTIGGHKAERIVLNAANDWKATLHDLPATIQGKPIESLIGFEEETAGDWTFRVSSIRERGAAYENEYEEWILPLAVTLSNSGDVPKKPMLQIRKSWVGEGVIPNRIDVVLTIEGHSETFFLTKDNG